MRKRKNGRNSYAILGLGRFGAALAVELAQAGADLLVIDKDEEKVRELRAVTENAYVVKGYDKKMLSETGVQDCDVAVVCIGEHMDVSILITLTLVNMGIPKIIAKANSPEHGEILSRLGAEVVFPERDMAIRLAHRLENPRVLDYIHLSSKINISKLMLPDASVGKTVQQLDLRGRFSLNIVVIEHGDNVVEYVRPDYTFRKGDILYLAGGEEDFGRLTDWIERGC